MAGGRVLFPSRARKEPDIQVLLTKIGAQVVKKLQYLKAGIIFSALSAMVAIPVALYPFLCSLVKGPDLR